MFKVLATVNDTVANGAQIGGMSTSQLDKGLNGLAMAGFVAQNFFGLYRTF